MAVIRQRTPPATVALTMQHVTHSGPEVFFKTCVAMKFVDDDDDDDDDAHLSRQTVRLLRGSALAMNWRTIFCGHHRSIFNL